MAKASTVDVTVHYEEVGRLLRSDAVHDLLDIDARAVAADARGRAPKDTGRGARSINSAVVLTSDEWEALISWDQFHYYMYFSEKGSRQRPARPFLVPALRAAQH